MAYIVKQIGDNYNQPTYYFECDDIEDLDNIPLLMVPMGSRCFVINEGITYALNSKQEWKVVKDGAVSEEDKEEDAEPEVRSNAVEYVEQILTEEQQMTARKNLDLYYANEERAKETVYSSVYVYGWMDEINNNEYVQNSTKYVISINGIEYDGIVETDYTNVPNVGTVGTAYIRGENCPISFTYDADGNFQGITYIDNYTPENGTWIYLYKLSEDPTRVVHTIPAEYIPDEIPRQTDLNQMEASIYNNLGDAVKTTRQDLSSIEQNMARYNLGLYHDYLVIVDDEEWNFENGYYNFTISSLSKGQLFNIRINDEFGTGTAEYRQGGSAAPSFWEIVFSFDNQPDWNVSYSEYGGFSFSALDEDDTYVAQEGNFTIYLAAHTSRISSDYLPSDVVYEHDLPSKIPYIADATDTVSVEQFNALLQALRDYGYMEQEAN